MQVFLGIGSNLGNRDSNIKSAVSCLEEEPDIKVNKVSPLLETDPVGPLPQGKFLNAAVEIEVDNSISPKELLSRLKEIEIKLGRKKSTEEYPKGHRWAPRVIDLDILLFGKEILEEDSLKIPHPLMDKRIFVLKPLCDIAPDAVHPLRKKTVAELLRDYGNNQKD